MIASIAGLCYVEFMNYNETINIILLLLDGKKHTAKDLSLKLAVCTKTIYRHLNKLCLCGIPILTTTGKYGGIKIAPEFCLSNFYFLQEELEILEGLILNSDLCKSTKHSLISKLNLCKTNNYTIK